MVLQIQGSSVWGTSGGWLSASCPHQIVYGVKFLLLAESPRDYVDLIMSLAKQPPIIVCDIPQMVSRHGNRRTDGVMFQPNEGRFVEPTEENIKAAKEGTLQVHLKTLDDVYPNMNPTSVTVDTKATLCLFNTFHQFDTKMEREVLRKVCLCPQLKGMLNSQVAEQLHRSRDFLNSMNPSSHIFSVLNILDSNNTSLNQIYVSNMKKVFKKEIIIDDCSKAVIDTQSHVIPMPSNIKTEKATEQNDDVTHSETGERDVHSEDINNIYIPEKYINDEDEDIATDETDAVAKECDFNTTPETKNLHHIIESLPESWNDDMNGGQYIFNDEQEQDEENNDIKEEDEEEIMNEKEKQNENNKKSTHLTQNISALTGFLQTRQTEMKQIEESLNKIRKDEWLKLPKFSVNLDDLLSLISPGWISDAIVNAYLSLIAFQKNLQDEGHVFVLPTHIATRWNNPHISPWLAKKVVLFKYEWILVPIHVPQHWILLVAHVPSKSVSVLDSLQGNNDAHIQYFSNYMEKRSSETGELGGPWKQIEMNTCKQADDHSCGSFVMLNAYFISEGVHPSLITPDMAATMRVWVLKKLLGYGKKGTQVQCDAEPCLGTDDTWIGCDVCGRWFHKNTCTTTIETPSTEWECDICVARYR
ncbi:uncharacterized protein [Antedon mediterranea]|uniref:uncharacterized protein n=1 Tax=Antedon mediterranea TaxID=105859 RepID=UPI003AF7E828